MDACGILRLPHGDHYAARLTFAKNEFCGGRVGETKLVSENGSTGVRLEGIARCVLRKRVLQHAERPSPEAKHLDGSAIGQRKERGLLRIGCRDNDDRYGSSENEVYPAVMTSSKHLYSANKVCGL